eukprot:scaffold18350_cov112-Isochrysis_galbana.AAC.4
MTYERHPSRAGIKISPLASVSQRPAAMQSPLTFFSIARNSYPLILITRSPQSTSQSALTWAVRRCGLSLSWPPQKKRPGYCPVHHSICAAAKIHAWTIDFDGRAHWHTLTITLRCPHCPLRLLYGRKQRRRTVGARARAPEQVGRPEAPGAQS